jgi:hypothetical protein
MPFSVTYSRRAPNCTFRCSWAWVLKQINEYKHTKIIRYIADF